MSRREALRQRARQIPFAIKAQRLRGLREVQLHVHLKSLFSEIYPEAVVEITHGTNEFGGDLVVVCKDPVREIVAAVIVKVGDLRGEVGGATSKILEQVKQCIDLPRSLSSRVDTLRTTEVWVVLAGDMSDSFRKRIVGQVRAEYKTNLTTLAMDWLVESFTAFCPEVFFGGEVMGFIERQIYRLETESSLSTRAASLNLSEWYVEPQLAIGGVPVEVQDDAQTFSVRRRLSRLGDLHKTLQVEKRIILCGDPGAGKTTALRKLALDMFRNAENDTIAGKSAVVPLLTTAREILACQAFDDLRESCISRDALTEDVIVGTVIVDGLDEVEQESRKKVLERTLDFCESMRCSVIVGSRKVEVIKNPLKGVCTYEILPLRVNQAFALFAKLVHDVALLSVLKEGLAWIEAQLPMTPLSLILLVEIAEDEHEVPASLCDLYSRYFELVLGKWDLRDKGVTLIFKYETKLHFLSELAWSAFLQQDSLEIPRDVFDVFVEDYVITYGLGRDRLNEFVAEVERAGILELREIVAFRHRSFLDYFAAAYLLRNPSKFSDLDERTTDLYFSDLWGDVAFFYAGMVKSVSARLLNLVASRQGEDFATTVGKFFVGRLLQAGWMSEHDIKLHGIRVALANFPTLLTRLQTAFEDTSRQSGYAMTDFILMVAASWSLGSRTLAHALKDAVEERLSARDARAVWEALTLSWVLLPYLDEADRRVTVNRLLAAVGACEGLSSEEKARMLIILIVAEDEDKNLRGAIARRLRRVAKQHPAILRRLLPEPRQGYRP